jgi:hypothetical protein
MKNRHPRPATTSVLSVFFVLSALAALGISGCTSEPAEVITLRNVPVDSAVFWPPSIRYAHNGDLLSLHMRGVQRQRKCAKADTLDWNFRRDSLGAEFFTPKSQFQVNTSCAADPKGLDSLYKYRVYTLVGKYFYLETPDGRRTDSVLFISGDAPLPSRMDTLRHVVSSGSVSTKGRLTFRDSTAAHPRRSVEADSLASCEVLQAAVFDRRGDTLVVRARSIQGTALPVSLLPACSGIHADTIEVVPNLHRFP